jgi:hypothetical protein
MAKTQANISPLALISLGKGLQRSEKNKSVGPDCVSGDNLKLGTEDMIPYHTRLRDITMNNDILPGDWMTARVIPVHKGVIDH